MNRNLLFSIFFVLSLFSLAGFAQEMGDDNQMSIFEKKRALREQRKSFYDGIHKQKENSATIGIIEKVKGQAKVRRGRSGSTASVAIGLRIYENDTIFTEKGRIHVRFKDGTYVEVGEDSKFEVERVRLFFDDKNDSVYRFDGGYIRFVILENKFLARTIVKSLFATVKVEQGSEFYFVQPADAKDLSLAMIKGKAVVFSTITNEEFALVSPFSAQLRISGLIHKQTEITTEQKNYLRARTKF
ncbi:MAG: hypothetical protein AB7F43_01190 [Bacteriovoracia bacterium]